MSATIDILLADDHALVRDGIRARLESLPHIRVIGEAANGREVVELAQSLRPDVVLMDINMPCLNGLEATRKIIERWPQVRVLILTMHDNKEYIVGLMAAGAKGYILKDVSKAEMIEAIERVHRGENYLSSGVGRALLDDMTRPSDDVGEIPLTQREKTILVLLAEGLSNKEIARRLFISVRTVESHRANIKQKLGVTTSAGLARYALKHGLVADE